MSSTGYMSTREVREDAKSGVSRAHSASFAWVVDRLCPAGEKRKNRVGGFRADHGGQFFARRAAHAGNAAECRQQRLAPARTHAGHMIEFGAKVAHRAGAAMERHREPMCFVANALDQQECRIVRRE